MDRNLALEFVRVTEAAAIAAAGWIGKGDKNGADQAAVDAMRKSFNEMDFSGTVVIGEGQKDEAPELYTGEKVGKGGIEVDLAVDPLECTDSVAYGRYNALSVIVGGPKGTLLSAPDTYMEKIAAGPLAAHAIDLDARPTDTVQKVAKALYKKVEEVTVVILDRERHKELIEEVRRAGARVRLITDGDIAGALAPSLKDSGIDILMGIGASTEAVLGAAGIKTLGGEMFCRFKPRNDADLARLTELGLDTKKTYSTEDLAKGDMLTFTATGIIDGPLLSGIRFTDDGAISHSVVMRGKTKTIRYMTTHHHRDVEGKFYSH
ncbi:MAG: class II fructose-bisphosphatase [Patescibacteria group bacterium]|nr:class II fructose-bisphosphatase [Patescibacteria group bacterium]